MGVQASFVFFFFLSLSLSLDSVLSLDLGHEKRTRAPARGSVATHEENCDKALRLRLCCAVAQAAQTLALVCGACLNKWFMLLGCDTESLKFGLQLHGCIYQTAYMLQLYLLPHIHTDFRGCVIILSCVCSGYWRMGFEQLLSITRNAVSLSLSLSSLSLLSLSLSPYMYIHTYELHNDNLRIHADTILTDKVHPHRMQVHHLHMLMLIHVHIQVHTNLHIYTYIYIFTSIYTHILCTYCSPKFGGLLFPHYRYGQDFCKMCRSVSDIHIYIYTHTYVCMYICICISYIYIHIHVYVCMYVCMYVYT